MVMSTATITKVSPSPACYQEGTSEADKKWEAAMEPEFMFLKENDV